MENILVKLKEELSSEKVVVACSTGVDSMTLLNLVIKVCESPKIIVAHVNHQKRKQSDIEEQYIKKFCDERNIKCYVRRLEQIESGNFQSIAREKRYQFFEEILNQEKAKYLLLAHHADDNLETIIMRLIKSSSLKGYAGMEEKSINHNFIIYRPFLNIPKSEIIKYANNNNIKYFEDSSNQTLDYTRNRIRHLITPILLEENPNLYASIKYYNQTLLNANEIIENNEKQFIKNNIIVDNNNGLLTYTLSQKLYDMESNFMKRQILFRLLKKYRLSSKCIEEIMKKIDSSKQSIVSNITPNLAFIKEHNQIIFTESSIKPLEYILNIFEDGVYDLPNGRKIEVSKNNCNFFTSNYKICYNIESLPLIIRTRMVKDRINNTLISDYLTKLKLPYMVKKDILLLCDQKNKVIAVLGYKGGKKWQI